MKNKQGSTTVSDIKRIPWGSIVALAMGMLVYGVAESYGPVTAISNIIPSKYAFLALSLPYIAGGFGALLSGFMSDSVGRKRAFILTAALIVIGMAIYLINATNIIALVISFILVGMAAIGLETPILTIIAESVPAKWRGNMEVIVQNFGNLGVAILFIPLMMGLTMIQTEAAIALLILAPLAALIIGYLMIRESLPWAVIKGNAGVNIEDAWRGIDGNVEPVKPTASLALRLLMLLVIGVVQDVAFVYITYDVGYLYLSSSLASSIPLIGGFIMTVFGVIFGALIVHKTSRKTLTVASYGSLTILWVLFWVYEALTGAKAGIGPLLLLSLLFLPLEATWGVRAMLEPELFPTQIRGRYVSYVRALVWIIAGIITGLLTLYVLPLNYEFGLITAIFTISLVTTIIWYIKGFETNKKSLLGHDVKNL